jgi:asparagine N-glycosylation enzyme membrane subunit Stt3
MCIYEDTNIVSDLDTLLWIKDNIPQNSVFLNWWDYGKELENIANMKPVIKNPSQSLYMSTGCYQAMLHNKPLPKECEHQKFDSEESVQSVAKFFTTDDEKMALDIVKKYDVDYVFITKGEIGKFSWISFISGQKASIRTPNEIKETPGVTQVEGMWTWSPWIFHLKDVKQDEDGNPIHVYEYPDHSLAVMQKNEKLIPIYNNRFVVNHIIFFLQDQQKYQDLSNFNTTLENLDGLVWVSSDFKYTIYFPPSIKDSMFTKLFYYNAEALNNFELVYSTPEIKLFKVIS